MSESHPDSLKTPPKPSNIELIVHSMPHSQGTAASAEYRRSELIRDVKIPILEDLKSSATCSFEDMLIALIAMTQRPGRLDKNEATRAREAATETLIQYLQEAATYINGCLDGNTNDEARKLRDAIKNYCEETQEAARYEPLARVLNMILFRDIAPLSDDNEIIFHINDPAVIESKRLEEVQSTKRKPDIVAITCKVAQKLHGLNIVHKGRKKFEELCRADLDAFHNRTRLMKLTWSDVLQSWELKSSKKKIPFDQNMKFSGDRFSSDQHDEEAEQIPIHENSLQYKATKSGTAEMIEQETSEKKGKGKRPSEDRSVSSATKRQKTIATNDTHLPPIVQCALYAVERLICDPSMTHTIDLILQDDVLRLWWYDKQGAIQSTGIKITQHLPHFVTMIMIFQRFDKHMWGQCDLDSRNLLFDHVPGAYKIDKGTEKIGYQLIGRSTYTADVLLKDPQTTELHKTRKRTQDATDNVSRRFMKVSWPEATRIPEPDIIKDACTRAENHPEIKDMVVPHLPTLYGSRVFLDHATDTIRHLLGLSGEGFRLLRICLFGKLRSVIELEPDAFWKAYWEILRCHALLWKLGIAHGDISVSNMMYDPETSRGVLNDFDLAAHVDKETDTASSQGCRRTGTLPYMALQLLTDAGWNGHIARRYRHDLESFYWCLAWVCGCVKGQQENRSTPEFVEWLTSDHNQCRRLKTDYARGLNRYPTTTDFKQYRRTLKKMGQYWYRLDDQILRQLNTSDEELSPSDEGLDSSDEEQRRGPFMEKPSFVYLQRMLSLSRTPAVPVDFPMGLLLPK